MPQEAHKADLELDLSKYELRQKGRRLRLEKQPMELLILLAKRKGELVTREQIAAALWGKEVFVDTDQSVHAAIRKIRIALRDDPNEPRFIETVVGKGYRFVGEVTVLDPSQGEAKPTNGQPALSGTGETVRLAGLRRFRAFPLLAASVLIVGLLSWLAYGAFLRTHSSARIRSVAILPLDNMSGDASQEYFADGITDELITNLAQVSSLRVISRTTMMQYKSAKKTLPQMARELNVDGVVEGSVVRSGDRVRIRVQLIDSHADRNVWARSFEREMPDVVGLEREIAKTIADQISAEITPREQERLAGTWQVSPEAYDAYLKSRYLLHHRRNDEGVRESVVLAESAVHLDPNYPLAQAGLAEAYFSWSYLGGAPAREVMPKALEAAKRAVALDDDLSEAHAVLGTIEYTYEWNWDAAGRELQRAIQLNPGNSDAHLFFANYFVALGKFKQAHEEIEKARKLDPLSLWINRDVGRIFLYQREPNQAVRAFLQALAIDPNNQSSKTATDLFLAAAYEQEGQPAKALATQIELQELRGGHPEELHALQRAGREQGLKGFCRERLKWPWTRSGREYEKAVLSVCAGDREGAFRYLGRALEERSDWLTWSKVDPALDPLRSDPRWTQLARAVGAP